MMPLVMLAIRENKRYYPCLTAGMILTCHRCTMLNA